MRLHVAFDAFGAEPPFIEGELLPRLEANYLIPRDLQLDAALHTAEAAVRLHQSLDRRFVRPAVDRRVRDMWAVGLHILGNGQIQAGHDGLLF